MLPILRLFPRHLVLNALKPQVGCRYISKIRVRTPHFLKAHEEICQQLKGKTNFGKFKKLQVI
jgi:hypothetical protein